MTLGGRELVQQKPPAKRGIVQCAPGVARDRPSVVLLVLKYCTDYCCDVKSHYPITVWMNCSLPAGGERGVVVRLRVHSSDHRQDLVADNLLGCGLRR